MIYTKKEFAEKLNMTTGNLSNYIRKLRQVVENEDGLIDDSNAQNAAFIEKRKSQRKWNNGPVNESIEPISLEYFYEEIEANQDKVKYDTDAEKDAVLVMNNFDGFLLTPTNLAFSHYAYEIVKFSEELLNREVEALEKVGAKFSKDKLISFYSERCQDAIENIKNNIDDMVNEIIKEHSDETE